MPDVENIYEAPPDYEVDISHLNYGPDESIRWRMERMDSLDPNLELTATFHTSFAVETGYDFAIVHEDSNGPVTRITSN